MPSPSARGGIAAAEHLDEMIVHDLDDHLPRRHRAQHLLADRLLAHAVDEVAHHRQRDIGFEQRDADFAQRGADIVLAQRAAPAQPVEDIVQAIAEGCRTWLVNPTVECTTGRRAKLADRPASPYGKAKPAPLSAAARGRYSRPEAASIARARAWSTRRAWVAA